MSSFESTYKELKSGIVTCPDPFGYCFESTYKELKSPCGYITSQPYLPF